MSKQTFTTSPTPHITVDACGGDMRIEGGAESEVVFEYDVESDQIQREGETFRVTFGGDGRVTCPPKSSLTLNAIGGDLSATDLEGTLAVQSVGGDVSLRNVGVVTLRNAGSDVSARRVEGDLRIDAIGGDFEARRVEGQVLVENVGGDLSARALGGGVTIKSVGGDASLETDVEPGKTYRVVAGGDLTLRLPADASARLSLSAGGEIEHRVPLREWSGDEHRGQGVMGDGQAQVELSAGGDLMVLPLRGEAEFDFSFNADAIGSQIEAKMEQFEHEMESRMHDLNAHIERMAATGTRELEERLRRIDIEGLSRRAERTAERVRRRALEAAERARAQAERASERARRRAERAGKHGGRHAFRFNVDFTPGRPARSTQPHTPASSATDAERLAILRMLEQKKITAEEAGRLLQALEG